MLASNQDRLPRGGVLLTLEWPSRSAPRAITISVESRTRTTPLEVSFNSIPGQSVERYVQFPDDPIAIRIFPPTELATLSAYEVSRFWLIKQAFVKRRNPIGRGLAYLRMFGAAATLRKIIRAFKMPGSEDYGRWIERYDTYSAAAIEAMRRQIQNMSDRPAISLLMPVIHADPELLARALDSVKQQIYPNWQLCIAIDQAADGAALTLARQYESTDPRIVVQCQSGLASISRAENKALRLANGAFVAHFGAADILPVHALFSVAKAIVGDPDIALLYTDEDQIDRSGRRIRPYFKSDWNPELFYARDYLGRLVILSAQLARRCNPDDDLILQAIKFIKPSQIHHIPKILYHRCSADQATERQGPGSSSDIQSLAAHFDAIGAPARVDIIAGGGVRRVIRPLPDPLPDVTLIIPTRDRVDLLRNCVAGLLERTDYERLSIVIIDNDSQKSETHGYFSAIADDPRVQILSIPGPFNYSRLNNQAVAATGGALIGFLNNDIDVISPGWLREMVSQAAQPGVGAVGAKLYYGDDTIQHAGVVLGVGGVGGHIHRGLHRTDSGYFGRLMAVQNVACVTAACMLTHRTVFEAVGGFDETDLAVAFNDVDLCLKIRRAGHSIVWTPFAELYHLESASRGDDYSRAKAKRFEREFNVMRRRWGAELDTDPYYNPNLTLTDEQGGLAFPPRVPLF